LIPPIGSEGDQSATRDVAAAIRYVCAYAAYDANKAGNQAFLRNYRRWADHVGKVFSSGKEIANYHVTPQEAPVLAPVMWFGQGGLYGMGGGVAG
jgi:hypothetical protein